MKMDMKMKNECQGKLFTTLYDYVLVEISSDVDKYLPKVDNDGVIRPQDASFRVEAGDFEQERKIIFLAQDPIQDHTLHLVIVTVWSSSVWNSSSLFP